MMNFVRESISPQNIAIFDEATSGLDQKSEAAFLKVFDRQFSKSTVLSIAHRLDLIIDYDKLLVLDDGRLVYCGRPRVYFN